jgi:HD-GYP domain-containing protein (c-di-GMP phosphodiesterase class II)
LNSSSTSCEGPPPRTEAWGLLESFLQELPRCDTLARQLRLALETVKRAVAADLVYLCSLDSDELLDVLGQPRPGPEWCRDFTRQLLREAPGVEGQLLRSVLPQGNSAELAPSSAALVQVSQSRGIWLTALHFTPGRHFQPDDIRLMALLRRLFLQYGQLRQAGEQLQDTLFDLVHSLTAAHDARSPHTCRHSERVAHIAVCLGRQMDLPEALLSDLHLGSLLHDIGKIGLSDTILARPSALTAREMALVQQHALLGDDILARVPQLAHLRCVVRHHHERWDGTGYPDRLAGDAIPLPARLVALADAFDAMNSDRPHRKALSPERIEAILTHGSGKQWDPQLLPHFLACRCELYAICGTAPS